MNSTKNTKNREKAHRRHSFVVLRNRALLLLPLVVIVVLVVYFSAGSLQHAKRRFDSSVYPRTYAAYVEKESAAYHLEPSMVYAVIKQESNFDPKCVSRAGAIGLMQLMPDTFSWLIQNDSSSVASQKTYTDEDLYDPQINIHYGCKYRLNFV
jgi:soluble lytic murein transglycosylase